MVKYAITVQLLANKKSIETALKSFNVKDLKSLEYAIRDDYEKDTIANDIEFIDIEILAVKIKE
jgi:hypothetical protein